MSRLPETIAASHGRTALRLLAAAGVATLIGACNQTQVAQSQYPVDYRQRHPITLKEGERTVEIFLGRDRGGLSPSQRADVLAFAQIWRREGTSGIVIEAPQGGPTNQAAADSMREVHSILAASGVPRNAVFVRTYRPAPAALASIRMNYTRMAAQVGPCGTWPRDMGPSIDSKDFENYPYWNLGCATQRNLAAMADNPSDLVQPRGETPAYAARRSVATDKYRQGQPPSGTYNGYDTGKISDLGK
jgi:pilus assembly protein CpaD